MLPIHVLHFECKEKIQELEQLEGEVRGSELQGEENVRSNGRRGAYWGGTGMRDTEIVREGCHWEGHFC